MSQRLDLKSSNKQVALQKFVTSWKIYDKTIQNNKLQIIAPTYNVESQLSDGSFSVSGIQDYMESYKQTL